jgi:hypothetical protein
MILRRTVITRVGSFDFNRQLWFFHSAELAALFAAKSR